MPATECSRRVFGFALIALSATAAAREIHYGAVTSPAVLACDEQAWQGEQDAAVECYRAIIAAASPAADKAEAAWALGEPASANDYFQQALDDDAQRADVLLRQGDLFAESHQDAEAMSIYEEVLAADPANGYARLGAAQLLAAGFEQEANEYLAPLLAGAAADGPRVGALLVAARVALEAGRVADGREALDTAAELIAENGWSPLEVYAMRAAADLVDGVEDSEWVARSLELNGSYGRIYSTPAHFMVITRRYRQAIELYEQAVAIDPRLADAHEQLGINLLRDNRVSAARDHLERAYALDPFSPRTVNTLRLIDSYSNFTLVEDRAGDVPIVLRLHKDEADVVAPYALALVREAIEQFTQRYGFALKEPVIVEMYPDHEDFAVRTAGMPGLGILGAAFGYLVAMDSPSSRPVEEFQWGTTLWHELAHVFTLESTHHLVPRWFSEGVSVFEEWRYGPGAGVRIPLRVFQAMRDERLLPIAELDEGFIRPAYEGQVIVSYSQAGLVCDFLVARFGDAALRDMLAGFAEGLDTVQSLRAVTGLEPEAFDAAFAASLDAQYGEFVAGMDEWQAKRRSLATALSQSNWERAAALAAEMIELHPEDVDPSSPYLALARARTELGLDDAAVEALEAFRARGGYAPEALVELANRLRSNGDADASLDVLGDLMYVDPLTEALHVEYGEQLLAAERPEEALREFEVALALEPHDMAATWYRLASAEAATGDTTAAQGYLLQALDIAPGYRPAQRLLLELAGQQ